MLLVDRTITIRRVHHRLSHKSVPQECPARVSQMSVPQECPTRVSRKSVPQECPARVSHKSVPQECPVRVSHKSVLQECHLDICSFLNVFAFGFVGSILFVQTVASELAFCGSRNEIKAWC